MPLWPQKQHRGHKRRTGGAFAQLHVASEAIGRLTPPELDSGSQDTAFRAELLRRYPSLRRFLPALLEVMPFLATGAGRRSSTRSIALRAIEGRPGRVSAASVPLQRIGGQCKRLVLANPQLADGELDRRAYSFCVREAPHRARLAPPEHRRGLQRPRR